MEETPLNIQILDTQSVLNIPKWKAQIETLLSSIWESGPQLLQESFAKVDRILLGHTSAGEFVGFSTWKLKQLSTSPHKDIAVAYIGIGALDLKFQSQGPLPSGRISSL